MFDGLFGLEPNAELFMTIGSSVACVRSEFVRKRSFGDGLLVMLLAVDAFGWIGAKLYRTLTCYHLFDSAGWLA